MLDRMDRPVFCSRMTAVSLPRRAILALPALAVGACAASADASAMAFTFRDGIGRRAAGPMMPTLADLFGHFPTADRNSWWRASHSVDSFSRLDEILPARLSRRGDTPCAWRRAAPAAQRRP
jgi:hypothetical protein